MVASLIEFQKNIIINAIKAIEPQGTWRCAVTDETSHKLITNSMKLHCILDEKISGVEQIEHKRLPQSLECVYILTPEEHIVKCLITDFNRPKPRYKCAHLLWTGELDDRLRQMIIASPARGFIASEQVLFVDFFPRESHLFTFRQPSSFYNLYHPECHGLVREHLDEIAKKMVCVCAALGEYPTIRYFRPPNLQHDARILSELLAKTVQSELDLYAQNHPEFPPQSNRPRGVLFVVDRSIDIYAPFLHEFTYQAMAHDLLPIQDGDKVSYVVDIATAEGNNEKKEMEINDEDQVWVVNRHQHMRDTIDKLMADFQKFLGDNKNFVDSSSSTSLYAIRDMMASLPQYQGQKDMYSLHLTMAQECMAVFEKKNLPDIALLEQSLATGLDENGRVPKNVAETLVRLLDEHTMNAADKVRLISLYLLWKDGLLDGDIKKLIFHSQLNHRDEAVLRNLDLFGQKVTRTLKDSTPNRNSSTKKKPNINEEEGYEFSRFVPAVKTMLEDHVKGTLDPAIFPYTKPELSPAGPMGGQENVSQASLRSARPTWARTRLSVVEPRQRVIVFMAGGATYSESRACYEVSKASTRDVFLGSSHMVTPIQWLQQLQNAKEPRSLLDLPADRPKKEVPKHLLEPDPVPKPPPVQQQPQRVQQAPRPSPSPSPAPQKEGGLKVHHHAPQPYYAETGKPQRKKKFGIF
ncbi:syntaxin binding protein 1 [Rhizina undulata]